VIMAVGAIAAAGVRVAKRLVRIEVARELTAGRAARAAAAVEGAGVRAQDRDAGVASAAGGRRPALAPLAALRGLIEQVPGAGVGAPSASDAVGHRRARGGGAGRRALLAHRAAAPGVG